MKIYWTRIYYRVKDEDQGYILPWAVITFNRWPTLFEDIEEGNGFGRVVPTVYRCWLMINLWLIRFEFQWTKNVRSKKKRSQVANNMESIFEGNEDPRILRAKTDGEEFPTIQFD